MKRKFVTGIAAAAGVALLPMTCFAVYHDLTQEQADSYYAAWMLTGAALFAFAAVAFVLFWKSCRKKTGISSRSKRNRILPTATIRETGKTVLIMIGIGFLLRLVAAAFSMGYGNDVALFEHWGTTATNGLFNTYNVLGENIDYPPGYVYILFFCGMLHKILGTSVDGYDVIIRLPAILCDCGIAWFIYRLCIERMPKYWTYFFVAFWIFNPLSFLDSTVWGQVDAVLTLALVAALYLIVRERFILSSVVFGAAVMLKPQAIIVLPVLFFALLKHKKIKTFFAGALAGVGTALGLALPFALSVDMSNAYMIERVTPVLELLGADGGGTFTKVMTPFAWIVSLFMGTAGHYNYACVNALNFFFGIGANWKQDSAPLWGLTYFWWGMIFIVIATGLTWFLYIKTPKNPSLPFLSAAVILSLVANFGPRMHERYFFPAVVFLLIAALIRNNRALFGLAALSTTFGFFTVLEILVDLNLGQPYMWPQVSFIRLTLSWGNVLIALATAAFAIADSFGKIDRTGLNKPIWR